MKAYQDLEIFMKVLSTAFGEKKPKAVQNEGELVEKFTAVFGKGTVKRG